VDASPVYHFYSELAEKEVLDSSGETVGSISDIAFSPGAQYPRAAHLILRRGLFSVRWTSVPWSDIDSLALHFHLKRTLDSLEWQSRRPAHDFTLVRDILDQQVVDTNGQKVIRVNDVRLLQSDLDLSIVHADVGIRGIVRRLGWQWWVDRFVEIFLARTDYLKEVMIHWRYVQPLSIDSRQGTLKLTVDQKQIAHIPHADFTDMMLNMDMYQRMALFKSMDPTLRPKVFADFDFPLQEEILENLDLKEAADLLVRVPADQATDLLEEMPKPVADSLLAQMETSQARRLSTLLGYTADSAGGIMTTELLTVPRIALVGGVLERLRRAPELIDATQHAYIVDRDNKLVGHVLLRRLLLAGPMEPVMKYAPPKPVYVRAKDSLREVAFVMEKYKLGAVPVVDNGRDRRLQGVITIDDILTKMIPLAWRRRVKRPAPIPPEDA